MDSGNSGSLQSSSGGDEECDSRAAAADSFIITSHVGGLPISPSPLFDPIANYMQHPNPLFLSPNAAWPVPGPASIASDPSTNPNPSAAHGPFNNNPLLSGSPAFQPPATAAGLQNQGPAAPRNPRKRSRASRRAPTTVLTTDTTNFRAMVQEFTGIPAPPFNSSSLPRSRLDLFGGARSAAVEPPYFRRPSPPRFPVSSAAVNLFNFPNNPLLNSLLQSNPKFFPNSPPKPNSFEIPPKLDGLDEFGISSGSHVDATLAGLPNLISTDQINTQKHPDHPDQAQIRSGVNGGYGFPMAGKTPSSDGKGSENVAGREGMVESWICSSE